MSEGQEPTTPDTQAVEGQQTEPEQPNTGSQSTWTEAAALAEIKKLRAEAAKYRKERETAEKNAADAAEQAAIEQGKYKELYETQKAQLVDIEPMRARLQELTERTQASNEKRIAAIPEAMQALIPEYDDPFKLAAWLDASAAVLSKPVAPSLNGGAGGSVAGNSVDEAKLKAQAVRLRVDPVAYVEAQKRARS